MKTEDAFESIRASMRSSRMRYLMLLAIPILYGYAVREVPIREIFSAAAGLSGPGVLVLFAANLMVTGAMCLRWAFILRRVGFAIPFSRLVLYRTAANAISIITPGPQFGGEPLQIHLLTRFHRVSPDMASASVTVDRVIELISNFLFLFAGGIYLMIHAYYPNSAFLWQMMTATGIVLILLYRYQGAVAANRSPLGHFFKHVRKRFGWNVSETTLSLVETTEEKAGFILRQPGRAKQLYGASALIHWLSILVEFWLVYFLLGMRLDMMQLVALVAAARLAFLVPIPAALGALEAGQVLMLLELNMDPAVGLAACLVMRARDLLFVSFGAGLSLFWLSSGRPESSKRIPETVISEKNGR